MTNATSIISSAPLVTTASASAAPSAAPAPAATTSVAAPKALVAASTTSISPRIISDPFAGLITQYLDSTGRVISQVPSSTAVAYLRAGLTANGSNPPSLDSHPKSHSTGTIA